MSSEKREIFGVADITISRDDKTIKFDGKSYLQAEGGSLSLTPLYTEFTYADFGETVVKRKLSGWEGEVVIVAGQEDADILELALASTEDITDTQTSEVVGAMDARIGSEPKGYKVNIHPRSLPANVKEFDYTIYNMASISGFEREYNPEQGNVTITLTMMPREGFDPSEPGNFFYRGGIDPNATP